MPVLSAKGRNHAKIRVQKGKREKKDEKEENMLTEEILEELKNTRNIALTAPDPDEDFLKLVEELLENDNETAREFEEFLGVPDLPEREKEAQFIIRQLKVFYKARGAEVYEQDGENRLLIHYPGRKYWAKISTCAEFSTVNLKVVLPVLAGSENQNRLSHALHSFNEDPDAGFCFFHLDGGSGEVSCIYRYSFAGGSFTEEQFHSYFRSMMKSAELYMPTIQAIIR